MGQCGKCDFCGGYFGPNEGRPRKFCSDACKMKYHRFKRLHRLKYEVGRWVPNYLLPYNLRRKYDS